jgi:hypothetical protein
MHVSYIECILVRILCSQGNKTKFSTVMTSPGPAFQECTGSCHVNVPNPKVASSQSAINRWSDYWPG